MKDIVPYIALLISIIGLFFPNQFSSVGDNIAKKKEKIKNLFLSLLFYLSVYGFPIIGLIITYMRPVVDKDFVFFIAFYFSLLVFNILFYLTKPFKESKESKELREAQINLAIQKGITNYIDGFIKRLDEEKSKKEFNQTKVTDALEEAKRIADKLKKR